MSNAKASSAGSTTRQAGGSRLGRIVRGVFAARASSRRFDGSGAPSRPRRLILLLAATGLLAALTPVALAWAAEAPTVSTLNYTAEPEGKVTLRGAVNPHGGQITDCHFKYGPTEAYGQSAPCAGVNEVQEITIRAASGQFKLSFESQTTPDLPYNASATEVQAALEALSSIGAGNVSVSGGPGDISGAHPYRVTFIGALGQENVDPLTVESGTTALGGEASAATAIEGNAGENEVQQITVKASSGQFKLSFQSQTTGDLEYNASAGEVQAALEGLSSIGAGNVVVSGGPGDIYGSSPYFVTFEGALAVQNVAQITVASGTTPLGGEATVITATSGATAIEVLGAGTTAVVVSAHLTGLTPGATYHWRLVAANSSGAGHSADATFEVAEEEAIGTCPNAARRTEQHSTFLPDCRAFEQVSPPDKNGGDIMADSQRTPVAEDGSAISYPTLTAFGDAGSTGIATEYLSSRGVDGWRSHSTFPPQEPLTTRTDLTGLEPIYQGFSADLTRGIFLAPSPLTADSTVANVPNLYLRDDLSTPGAGTYRLLSGCPICQSTSTVLPPPPGFPQPPGAPRFTGASSDFAHLIFESQQRLTESAPEGCENNFGNSSKCPPNLYEFESGTLRSVGFIPSSPATELECLDPACVPSHGSGQRGNSNYTPHTISADGSKVFFTVRNQPGLFMRVDSGRPDAHTVNLNASERAGEDATGGTPSPAFAGYQDATPDGSRVFFTSAQALTDDAPEGSEGELYMYDTSKPASDPHNLTLVSPPDQEPRDGINPVVGVLGISEDGSYVYFAANGLLLAGQPAVDTTAVIYVWHDGSLRFVAGIAAGFDEGNITQNWTFTPKVSRVTPDGLHLLFSSQHPDIGPTGYDQTCGEGPLKGTGCGELYLYDYETNRLSCASCPPDGTPAVSGASPWVWTNSGAAHTAPYLNNSFSTDGRFVFFSTQTALLPQDTNGVSDAYEYDSRTGTLHLLSSGTDPNPSYFMNASASGNDAFILTRQRLVGSDTDNAYDLYDVRVGGGFPEPPPAPSPCEGETCRGSAPPPPNAPLTGSSTTSGPGNQPIHRGCPKRTGRRRGKCVKPRHHRKHHSRPRGRASKQLKFDSSAQRAKPTHLYPNPKRRTSR